MGRSKTTRLIGKEPQPRRTLHSSLLGTQRPSLALPGWRREEGRAEFAEAPAAPSGTPRTDCFSCCQSSKLITHSSKIPFPRFYTAGICKINLHWLGIILQAPGYIFLLIILFTLKPGLYLLFISFCLWGTLGVCSRTRAVFKVFS